MLGKVEYAGRGHLAEGVQCHAEEFKLHDRKTRVAVAAVAAVEIIIIYY